MAIRQYMGRITRYLLILYKLKGRRAYIGKDELLNYLQTQMSYRDYPGEISLRSIQRDFKDIKEIFGEDIKFKPGMGYHIAEKDDFNVVDYDELLLNFDLLTALDPESHTIGCIVPEHHRPVGSDRLPEIIKAIKDRNEVYFTYTLVRHGNKEVYPIVKPYFIKQSLGLWYLVGINQEGKLRTYGIDRITDLQILDKEFKRDKNINADNLFKDCFGIWDDPDKPVEEIELSYSPLNGMFLKNNPLHISQTVLADNEEEFRISLRLKITNDFVMALLSRSKSLTVIRPLELRERIRDIYEEALKRNQ